MASAANTSLRLAVPVPSGGRFLSLGFERSFRHRGLATISCAGGCICAPLEMDMHSSKKYTYLQRTPPRWLMPASPEAPSPRRARVSWCEVVVHATRVEAGRLMLKALTISSAKAGNKSVSTNSLYSLP